MGPMKQRLLVCNCEKYMSVDGKAIAHGLGVSELMPQSVQA